MLVPQRHVSEFQMGTPKAINDARAMQEAENNRGMKLVTQAMPNADYVIYLYNICPGWDFAAIEQPPTFPHFKIPKCPKGEKFAYTTLPAFVNDPYEKPGTAEIMYTRRDGREAANSLVNPDAHPGNPFEAQFRDIEKFGNHDQEANNLNKYGIFWSFTRPDNHEQLDKEINEARKRLDFTLRDQVDKGNLLNAQGKLAEITPMMHFAMEYFGLQATWHMSHRHKTECPNCGDLVLEGIAYHRNAQGDLCIIDRARYEASVVTAKQQQTNSASESETAPSKPRTRTAR